MKRIYRLGPIAAASLVAGSIIGTGIFIKPATIAAQAGSVSFALSAWVVAGLLSLAGALTYGELMARNPAAGGEYALIKGQYGNFWAFLYGWMRFTIGAPGSAASYAVGASLFLHVFYPFSNLGIKVSYVAVAFIAFFTVANCITLLLSSAVQTLLTGIKVASLVAIFLALFLFGPQPAAVELPSAWPGMTSFAAALMAALWAYDGWNNLPMVAEEVRNPRKSIPWALAFGLAMVTLIYGATG